MTHIPTTIVYAEESDRSAAIERIENWCGKEGIKKYGIEFLNIEEARAKEMNLEQAMNDQYSPISLDETAKGSNRIETPGGAKAGTGKNPDKRRCSQAQKEKASQNRISKRAFSCKRRDENQNK